MNNKSDPPNKHRYLFELEPQPTQSTYHPPQIQQQYSQDSRDVGILVPIPMNGNSDNPPETYNNTLHFSTANMPEVSFGSHIPTLVQAVPNQFQQQQQSSYQQYPSYSQSTALPHQYQQSAQSNQVQYNTSFQPIPSTFPQPNQPSFINQVQPLIGPSQQFYSGAPIINQLPNQFAPSSNYGSVPNQFQEQIPVHSAQSQQQGVSGNKQSPFSPQGQMVDQITKPRSDHHNLHPTINQHGPQNTISPRESSSQLPFQASSDGDSHLQVAANEQQIVDDYLQDSINKLSQSAENHPDFIIANLLITYNFFLNRAHQLVLLSNDLTGTKTYFKMITLAIKALLVIVKQYNQCLNPKLELVVYYKLAKLYLYETQNLNRADDYINKAIAISTRNSLMNIKFVSEFLAGEILNKSNPKLLINYLNDRINFYHQNGHADLSHLFILMKVNNLLVTDCKTALIVLQSLVRNDSINELIKTICLLYEANLHLYKGSPSFAMNCLDQIRIQDSTNYPPQITAMKSLLTFQYYIQTNQTAQSKQILKELANFISLQRQSHWSDWNENGFFKISLSNNNTANADVPFQLLWLNSDEFVIMVYFLTGLHFLNDMSVQFERAIKIFGVCLGIIHSQLKELTNTTPSKRNFPIHQLTNKIIRLNFTRFLINYYQVWLKFTNNDFSGMGELDEFIKNYNDDNFTDEELCYYKLLIPKVFHLYAIFCQYRGDIKAAKYYFLKVKSLTSSFYQNQQPADITFMQLSLGIGGETVQPKDEFNELHIYSTFHLLIISNFELTNLAKHSSKNNDEISKCHTFITELYSDLTNAFKVERKRTSNSFTMNFTHSNSLLLLTNQVILSIYLNNGFISHPNNTKTTVNDSLNNSLIDLISGTDIPQGMTHIRVLVLYVLYLGSIKVEERNKYFDECVNSMSQNTENDQLLSLLILREIRSKNLEAGHIDNAKLNDLEIQMLGDKLKGKFKLANLT